MRECVSCSGTFDPNSLAKRRAGGRINTCPDCSDEPAVKPGQRISKNRVPAPLNALGFALEELREARLAPLVDFKGRTARSV